MTPRRRRGPQSGWPRELGRRDVLEEEAAGACPQRAEGVLVEVEGGEDQHAGLVTRRRGGDGAGRLDAVEHGHAHVHEHDVGPVELDEADGVGPVGRLADDLHVLLGLQDHAEALPQERLIVRQHQPDRHAGAGALQSRRAASTSQPPAARGPARSVPRRHGARSAIPARPWPPPLRRRRRRHRDLGPAVVGDAHETSGSVKVSCTRTEAGPSACFSAFVRASCTSGRPSAPPRQRPRRACRPGEPTHPTRCPAPARRARRAREPGWGAKVGRSFPDGRRSSAAAGRLVAQDAEHAPHVGQRLAPGARDLLEGLGRPRGVGGLGRGGGVGQGHHDLDVVRDHVVHLTGDAGPFGHRGQRRLLVASSSSRPPARPASRAGCAARAPRRRRAVR